MNQLLQKASDRALTNPTIEHRINFLKRTVLSLIFSALSLTFNGLCETAKGSHPEEEETQINHHISKMNLSNDKSLTDIAFIHFFPHLKELDLSHSGIKDNYHPISVLSKLEKLNLFSVGLTTSRYLTPLKNLKELKISCSHIGNQIKYLKKLPRLKKLDIRGGAEGVEKLCQLTSLRELTLSGVFNKDEENDTLCLPSLQFLTSLKKLKKLDISSNDYIFYIKSLTHLKNLENINLSGDKNIKDLHQIKKIQSLKVLKLMYLNEMYIPTLFKDLKSINKLSYFELLVVEQSIKLPHFNKKITIRKI